MSTRTALSKQVLIKSVLGIVIMAGNCRGADDFTWPKQWTAFGPTPQPAMTSGMPERSALLPGSTFNVLPSVIELEGEPLPTRKVELDAESRIDLSALFGGVERGKTVYLVSSVNMPEAQTVKFGAGADWFMQWWLNGEPVYDTLNTGNRNASIATDNHVFELPLKAGENILAVAAVSGSSSFFLAAGNPEPNIYAVAMAEGREKMSGASGHWSSAIDYKGAQRDFRRAADAAVNDRERAAALLPWARAVVSDTRNAPDHTALRAAMERVRDSEDITSQQRSEAYRYMAESHLLECEYPEALAAADKARVVTGDPRLWPPARMVKVKAYLQQRDLAAARRELLGMLALDDIDQRTRDIYSITDLASINRQLQWEAEAFLGALPMLGRLRYDHPRLFLNSEIWPAVKARATGEQREHFESLQKNIQDISPAEIMPEHAGAWSDQAVQAALVYRMTGDRDTLDKVELMLRSTVNRFLQRDDFNSRGYPRIAWLTALDWVWNDLTPELRRDLAADMLAYLAAIYADDTVSGRLARWPHYYERDVYFYGGLALLDQDMDDDVAFRHAFAALAVGLKHNTEGIQARIIRSSDDGAWHLNAGYYLAELATCYSWPFMHAWRAGFDGEIPAKWLSIGVPPEYALRQVIGLEHRHIYTFGYSRTLGRMRSDLLYDHLGHFIHFFADTHPQHAAVAQHLRARVAEECGRTIGQYEFGPFLQTGIETAAPAVLPEGLPIARHYENVGQVLMSSGFGADDTYALFACGGGLLGSEHLDSTHFTIYKRGYLAVDSGGRGAGEHSPNYWNQTVAHNCVLIRMPDETPVTPTGQYSPGNANSGGQNKSTTHAKVVAFESDRLYAYVATDATDTYHEDKCRQMVRQFIYLPPNHFVVFDRVAAVKAEYPKTWMLHTGNEPLIEGLTARADAGEGRIFARTLLPADAVMSTIGGPGKEFWADGRSWPLPANWPYWRNAGGSPDDLPEIVGGWQVRVTPGTARRADQFLHLIETADQTVKNMVETRITDDNQQVKIDFSAGMRDYSLTLNKTAAVGGHIQIRENGEVILDQALTENVMPQAGLAQEGIPPWESEFNVALERERLIRPLVPKLPEEDQLSEAAFVLGGAGVHAISSLIRALADQDAGVRRRAAWALGRAGAPDAVDGLAVLLADSDSAVRYAVATALGAIGPTGASALTGMLNDPDQNMRRWTALMLGRTEADSAVMPLIAVLDGDPEPAVRTAAAEALGHIKGSAAITALASALDDDDWRVRRQAGAALSTIGAAAAPELVRSMDTDAPEKHAVAIEALACIGVPAFDSLLAALDSDSSRVQSGAAAAMRPPAGDQRALQPLLRLAASGDMLVRVNALRALGRIDSPQAGQVLTQALTDATPEIRAAAATALGETGVDLPVDSLIAALADDAASVRVAAVTALAAGNDPAAVVPLISALDDTDAGVRPAAAAALGAFNDSRAVRPLIKALGDDQRSVAFAANASLKRITGRNVDIPTGWSAHTIRQYFMPGWEKWLEQQ